MTEPHGACARVGLTGLTVAEHCKDAEGQDVLLFIDNIFGFTLVSFANLQDFSVICELYSLYIVHVISRRILKYLLFLVVFHLLLDVNQL